MINFKRLEEIAYALEPARRNGMRCFHCAFILKRGRLVSIGYNQDKTHPKTKEFHYHRVAKVHAELFCALKGGKEDYSDHTMAVLRIDNNAQLNNSYPCNGCRHVIRQLGFSDVYYTDQHGDWRHIDPLSMTIDNKPNRFDDN